MIPPAVPAAQPPVEVADIKLGVPSGAAGGLQAVAVTTGLTLGAMGAVRGAKLLLEVNQKDGFDCQSCAWPSPDGDRHTFEFCENGVKAVADEATPRRITASLTGSIAGARSARGNSFPAACIMVSAGVFGAKVNRIAAVVRAANAPRTRRISSDG